MALRAEPVGLVLDLPVLRSDSKLELAVADVKTHCLLRAAASLMRDEDKGSEGGRRRQGDWQQLPTSGGLGLEIVCERDQ